MLAGGNDIARGGDFSPSDIGDAVVGDERGDLLSRKDLRRIRVFSRLSSSSSSFFASSSSSFSGALCSSLTSFSLLSFPVELKLAFSEETVIEGLLFVTAAFPSSLFMMGGGGSGGGGGALYVNVLLEVKLEAFRVGGIEPFMEPATSWDEAIAATAVTESRTVPTGITVEPRLATVCPPLPLVMRGIETATSVRGTTVEMEFAVCFF